MRIERGAGDTSTCSAWKRQPPIFTTGWQSQCGRRFAGNSILGEIGLAFLAVVLVVYGIGFAFASAAAGISEALPVWLSLLIVTGAIFLIAAIAGLLAVRFAKKASPPKPAQAIEEAERTVEAIRSHV